MTGPRSRGWIAVRDAGILLLVVIATVVLRGYALGQWERLNPDEAELLAQARAALRDPLPYSSWTMGTTGPFWPYVLALFGLLGAPLTVAFAHMFAAVLVGLFGALLFLLFRRHLGTARAAVLAAVWWLPFALVYPWGGTTDFAGMATESLPIVLIVASALLPLNRPSRLPVAFLVAGLLAGVAIGAKYQVAPVAAALVIAVLLASPRSVGRTAAAIIAWGIGAALPLGVVALAVVLSPATDGLLLAQQFHFLGGYTSGVPLSDRLVGTSLLLLRQPFLYLALAVLVRLSMLSTPRVRAARIALGVGGLAAVFAGGMAFGHYLIVLYAALALAAALPVTPGARLLPRRALRIAFAVAAGVAVLAVATIGVVTGRLVPATPATVAAAVSPDSVVTDPGLARVCPPGSAVIVWGWSPELYVHYDWRNAIPVFTALGTTTDQVTHERLGTLLAEALDDADCVVDAVGAPFFLTDAGYALTTVYPDLAEDLETGYRLVTPMDCTSCTVLVRR